MISRVTILSFLVFLATLVHAVPLPNPHLTVQLPGIDTWLFTEAESELVTVHTTSGIPLDFTWMADADWYGGTIAGYRYGWDLLDPADSNDPGWMSSGFEPDLLGIVPVDFQPGTHTLHVMVIDEEGSSTLAGFLLDIGSPLSSHTIGWEMLKASFRGVSR